ncbi:MAG: alpha/beta hydrolase [Elusimicrobia bacterium]|nr:alpha/beta hydrolase [Elusimicrobiota bacterium]
MATAPVWVYLALGTALFWLGLRWFERVQLYIPERRLDAHPGSVGLGFETVRFEASDGVRLHGWWIPGEPGAPAVLLAHGNAGNVSHRVEKARILHGLGLSVLLFDYRGYGLSDGRPTEQGLYRDGEAAFRHLTAERGLSPGDIILYGESLGCGVAVELARRHAARSLVIESAFTSTADMGRLVFPFLPVDRMVNDRFDNLAKIGQVRSPVLVLHSPQDEIIPFAMGRRLFEAAPQPKALVELSGGHNDGFLRAGNAYPEALGAFIVTRERGGTRVRL